LQDLFGEKDDWPFKARIHFAALVRDAADRDFDPSLQISHARQAISTLLPIEGRLRRLAQQGDTRPILVLSRAFDVLFRKHRDNEEEEKALEALDKAISRAQTALQHKPNVTAWRLYLKLQDQKSDLHTLDESEFERRGRPISDELYGAISDCEEWLEHSPQEGGEGRLRLWCVERRWSEQGSLIRAMRDEQYSDLSDPQRPKQTRRREVLGKIYLERRDTLEWIKRKYDPFPTLYQELARLEFQYQRSIGISGGSYNMDDVNNIYVDALKKWPESLFLKECYSEYLRHIWEFGESISRFRDIKTITSDGEQRRRVQAKLAEALLITATYYDDINLTDEIDKSPEELIREAENNVSEISGFRKVSEEASYLSDRIQLELPEGSVDWEEIEKTYDLIVGGTGLYYETLSSNISDLEEYQ